jgi:hypothetical protein
MRPKVTVGAARFPRICSTKMRAEMRALVLTRIHQVMNLASIP